MSCGSCTDSSTARQRTWTASHHLLRGRPSCPLRSENGNAKKTGPHKRTSSNGRAETDGLTTRPAASFDRPLRPGQAATDGRTDGLLESLDPRSAGPCGPAGRRRTDRLPDQLLLTRQAGPCGPAGWRRTDRQPDLLLPRSACPCGPAGRRRTDGVPDLLLLTRPAGPCGPAGRRRTDGLPDLLLPRPAGPCGPAGWRGTDRLPDLLLGRPLRPGRAATDGRTQAARPAATSPSRPLWPCRAATDGRTTRPAAAASPGRTLRPGRAATDGRTTRPAAASLGRPLGPGRAATDGRTTRPAAAGYLAKAQVDYGKRYVLGMNLFVISLKILTPRTILIHIADPASETKWTSASYDAASATAQDLCCLPPGQPSQFRGECRKNS